MLTRRHGGRSLRTPAPSLSRCLLVEVTATAAAGGLLRLLAADLASAPAGFPRAHEHIEDLKRTNLYTLTEFSEADVVADGFLDRFAEACERAAPLVEFETKALGLRW